ncbi:MAG: HD domain-containing protein, partial [Spirochaetales bacterium]|nr:HD domain-containing protein [Spirochaetales bacterium]
SQLAVAIGIGLGLPEEDISSLELGGLLHDIGMIGISDTIINEARPLDNSEYDIIKQHPADGKRMIELIPHLQQVLTSILSHHERFDGSGYPEQLEGTQIPIAGRVIALADVFDALITDRPQRKKMDSKEAVSYIVDQSGISFDPEIVLIFKDLAKDIDFPDKYY